MPETPREMKPLRVSNGHRFIGDECRECRMAYAAYEANGYPWCQFTTHQQISGGMPLPPGSRCSSWCGYCGGCN